MTTPSTGKISLDDVNIELGNPPGTAISFNDFNTRKLAGRPTDSSEISMDMLRNKTFRVTLTIYQGDNKQEVVVKSSLFSGYRAGRSDAYYIIQAGKYTWSDSVNIPALTVQEWNIGDTITIVNNGYIIGKGGLGASGRFTPGGANGQPGGPALYVVAVCDPLTRIENNAGGYIAGGGGGGGAYYGSGGGGAGGGRGGDFQNAGGAGGGLGQPGSPGNPPRPAGGSAFGAIAPQRGGGGGRILPGTGGAPTRANNVGQGGGAGGGGGSDYLNPQASGAGGSGSNIGNPGGFVGGGGGGWGQSGGGSYQASAGSGGAAVTGGALTVNNGQIYGAII